MIIMRTTLLVAIAAGLVGLVSTQASAGWVRHGTLTTPRGTYTGMRSGGCSGGSCYRSGEVTGPDGRSVYGSGSVTRTAPGQFSSSGSVTGPEGRTATRQGETSCSGGQCAHTGTITGPYGGTVTTTSEGTVER